MSIGVYALIFPDGKVYIGSTTRSFRNRLRRHMRVLLKGSHCNQYMQRLFNKYGKPEFCILEKCSDPEEIYVKEQTWIDAQDKKMLINLVPARLCPAYKRSTPEEVRKKISESHKGKSLSKEHIRSVSDANRGKHRSVESRKRMSESAKGNTRWLGKRHSEETKRRISESLKRWWEDYKDIQI